MLCTGRSQQSLFHQGQGPHTTPLEPACNLASSPSTPAASTAAGASDTSAAGLTSGHGSQGSPTCAPAIGPAANPHVRTQQRTAKLLQKPLHRLFTKMTPTTAGRRMGRMAKRVAPRGEPGPCKRTCCLRQSGAYGLPRSLPPPPTLSIQGCASSSPANNWSSSCAVAGIPQCPGGTTACIQAAHA
jgi:hypothetical protein